MSLEKEFYDHLQKIEKARLDVDESNPAFLNLSEACYPVNMMIPISIMQKIAIVAELRDIPLDIAIIETIYDSKLVLLPVDGAVYGLDSSDDQIVDVSKDFLVNIALVDPDILDEQKEL